MGEPEISTDPALQQVTAAWDQARTERTLPGVHRKRAQRRVRTVLAASATTLLVLGGVLTTLRTHNEAPPRSAGAASLAESFRAPAIAARTSERTVEFADGSQVLLLDAAAKIVVERESDSAIDVRLPTGHVRVEVTPHKARTFRVVCDGVVVHVLGTGFELTRDGTRTHVRVLHGRVAVTWPGGGTQLGAGQAGWFPTSTPNEEPEAIEAAAEQPTRGEPERPRATSWRQQAEQGDYPKAYQMLARQPARLSADVEELLLAADAARLSGHPAEAVPYLQTVTDRHAHDPRAPLAAFTLGGVLMNQLGRPREAAAAYARARALSGSGALSGSAPALRGGALSGTAPALRGGALSGTAPALRGGALSGTAPALRGGALSGSAPALRGGALSGSAPALRGGALSGSAPALRGGALSGSAPALRGGALSGSAPALRGGALSGSAPALRGGASLSPSSALSEDALARQVEAAYRAADASAALALALEYLERYPDGRRVKAVRRFGGVP